jgi:hypothetical protein
MVPNTTASPSTGRHCAQVRSRSRGRPTASRTSAATYWRTTTTPTGPRTGKASDPIAAPTWFGRPLPAIATTPYPRPGVAYRPVREAEPIAVRLAWWRDDPHPATQAAIELLTTQYRGDGGPSRPRP